MIGRLVDRLADVLASDIVLARRSAPGHPIRVGKLQQFMDSPAGHVRTFWRTAYAQLGEELAADISRIRGSERLNILPPSFLFSNNLNDFAAEFQGGISEVVHWPVYDEQVYAAAGQSQLIFFGNAAGQVAGGYGTTNMRQGGAMSGGEAEVVMSVRVKPFPVQADAFVTAAIAPAMKEWYNVMQKTCWLEFIIGDKQYIQAGPLTLFPEAGGLGLVYSSTATSNVSSASMVQNGTPDNFAMWKQDPPILILPTRTFQVTANWKALETVTTAGHLRVTLDGYRIRSVQ